MTSKLFRDYPSNVPRKLIRKFRAAGCVVRKLEDEIDVNSYYICKLLNEGEEPTDKTLKGQEARVKLFLPRKIVKHKTGVPKYDRPAWLYFWYRLPKDERHEVIRSHVNGTDEERLRQKKETKKILEWLK